MPIRTASDSELELVYRMGFDVWGEGLGLDDYLAGCRASPKYAAGVWRVLAGDVVDVAADIEDDAGVGGVDVERFGDVKLEGAGVVEVNGPVPAKAVVELDAEAHEVGAARGRAD